MKRSAARLIVAADAEADIVVCPEGLSFWGGVDPDTGRIIDTHHPLHGQLLAGKIVLMLTSRGSCSGSGVLLQLALNGCAPAAFVFREEEEVLTLGALIASKMFGKTVGVVRLSATDYGVLAAAKTARLDARTLSVAGHSVKLHPVSESDLDLTPADRAKLDGRLGKPAALAMDVICAMAAAQGATRLIDVTRGHIDGCIYAHDANLIFAEAMAQMGARVAIPTTINAISVDRENWTGHGVPRTFGQAASRLADAYVRMGAHATFTCAPYLADDAPKVGEDIGWSESNAVIFANSVLGARSAKHPDYLDLFIAITGRVAEAGVYLARNRRAGLAVDVDLPTAYDDALWPLLGWIVGRLSPDRIPLLRGLEDANPSRDDLRALCAAFGTTSAMPLLHIAGVTPEGDIPPEDGARRVTVTGSDFADAWRSLNSGPETVDLVALGSPHLSLEELRHFAALMAGQPKGHDVSVIVTLGRDVFATAQAEGLVEGLQSAGVQFYSDLCWCSITEPMLPPDAKALMTNSGKYAHYAPGLCGKGVRFGSLADCATAARTGLAPSALWWTERPS